ncbi:MAG: nuclear transport factor 2 family protein [Arenimonas sp.]
MNSRFYTSNIILAACLTLTVPASAHEPEKAASMGMPVFVQNIAPAAVDAAKVVDAFSGAIKTVKLDVAKNLLDPKVIILESGGSERSRDEYMGGHAIADANFLQNAKVQLRYRQAQAEGNFAWVATESDIMAKEDGKDIVLKSTETMVLKKSKAGWKIVHIHWSSRSKKS